MCPACPMNCRTAGSKQYIPRISTWGDKYLFDKIHSFMVKLLLPYQLRPTSDEEKLEAIYALQRMLKNSMSSGRSVPKPLKFMNQYWSPLETTYCSLDSSSIVRKPLSDLISVIAMLRSEDDSVLKYCILGTVENVASWGLDYIRHICKGVIENDEWMYMEENMDNSKLNEIIAQIGPYMLAHNCEVDLCDLLSELYCMEMMIDYVDASNYKRVCQYVESLLSYGENGDVDSLENFLVDAYTKFGDLLPLLNLFLRINAPDRMGHCFAETTDEPLRMQMAFFLNLVGFRDTSVLGDRGNDRLVEIVGNSNFSQYFLRMAEDLDVLQLKPPETALGYKIVNARTRGFSAVYFANAFMHAGFTRDYGIENEGDRWIKSEKPHEIICSVAAIGLVNLWNVDNGLQSIANHMFHENESRRAGAYLACGIAACGQRADSGPVLAVLSEAVSSSTKDCLYGAILGLGFSHAGTNSPAVIGVIENSLPAEVTDIKHLCYACYSIGLIAVGSQDQAQAMKMVAMLEKVPKETKEFSLIYGFLGVAFVLYDGGSGDEEEEDAWKIEDRIRKNFDILVGDLFASILRIFLTKTAFGPTLCPLMKRVGDDMSNYADSRAGGGNDQWEDDLIAYRNAFDIIKMGVKCCNEDLAAGMLTRILDHMFRYGQGGQRRGVPLALAVMFASRPESKILSALSKYLYMDAGNVSISSAIALGVVGAGTNSVSLVNVLRKLVNHAINTQNDDLLMTARVAQSLNFLGKGTLTLSPRANSTLKKVALVSLVGFLSGFLDTDRAILNNSSYLIYLLTPAISSHILVTYDENLKPLSVLVRVGKAVDVAGERGRRRGISGFQTYSTPVLLCSGQRAELATDKYIPLTPYLEGVVILRPNPH